MSTEINKAVALAFMERGFNQGDLSALDDHLAPDGVDHQEPAGTDYREHLKAVITMLRTAFPDLRFEIHHILAEGDIVAFHSTMTGTHLGALNLGPLRNLPPTGRKIAVAHMHFVRIVNGRSTDLWHVWDIPGLMRQLGMAPETQKQTA
jgi:predicted ester cyclase